MSITSPVWADLALSSDLHIYQDGYNFTAFFCPSYPHITRPGTPTIVCTRWNEGCVRIARVEQLFHLPTTQQILLETTSISPSFMLFPLSK